MRVLPPREDHPNNRFYHWVATHGNLPGIDRPVLCLSKMFDEPCPVCLAQSDFRRQGRKDDADSLAPTWRALVNVVALDKDGGLSDSADVKVWAIPRSLLDEVIEAVEELPKRRRDITHPETGTDLLVGRKGEGKKKTRYRVAVADASTPFESEELLEGMHALPEVYEKIEFQKVAGYLTTPTASKDPFADDEDEGGADGAIEGEYREVPPSSHKPSAKDEDDEESEEEPAKKPASTNSNRATERQRAARAALQRRVESARGKGVKSEADEDDDDDEDGDEED